MWIGVGEDYLLKYTAGEDYLAKWTALLQRMNKWRFNVVRLSARFADAPATAHSIVDFDKLDAVINLIAANGKGVILDLCHNWQDHYGWFGSQAWIDDWVAVANHYKGDPRILAYELFNEPFTETWAPNITSGEDVLHALVDCTDAIRATGDTHMIWFSDPGLSGYGDLELPDWARRDNVMFPFHGWSRTVAEAEVVRNWWLYWKNNVHPGVIVGEFGTYSDPEPWETQKEIAVGNINFCLEHNIGFLWWLYSTDHFREDAADEVLEASNYTPTPPIDLPLIGGITLLIADISLIAYYLARKFLKSKV